MKIALRWIVLIWSVLVIPYSFGETFEATFFSLLFLGLVIGLMISDLLSKKSLTDPY